MTFWKSLLSPSTTTESTDYPLRIGGALRQEKFWRGDHEQITVTVLKKRTDEKAMKQERASDTGLRQITQKLLVALVENEINSAFIFVAVARTAYLASKFSDGNAALSKAEAIYAQARELAHDSCGENQQAIADHLRELRLAIDGLMTGDAGK